VVHIANNSVIFQSDNFKAETYIDTLVHTEVIIVNEGSLSDQRIISAFNFHASHNKTKDPKNKTASASAFIPPEPQSDDIVFE
jgi:hypothetical protein